MLKKPEFVQMGDGQIQKLFCKMCGTQIAGMVASPRGSGPLTGQFVERFKRFPNYAEAKFKASDGSFHVTNGCKNCLTKPLSAGEMQALYSADAVEMGIPVEDRGFSEVVTIDTSGSGVL